MRCNIPNFAYFFLEACQCKRIAMKIKILFVALFVALFVISGSAIGAEARTDGAKNRELQKQSLGTVGGWSDFNVTMTKEAKNVFEEALTGIAGVSYTPLAYATQIVAGMNYQFFCNAKVVSPGASHHAVMIYIFAPLPGQGKPRITAINQVTQ